MLACNPCARRAEEYQPGALLLACPAGHPSHSSPHQALHCAQVPAPFDKEETRERLRKAPGGPAAPLNVHLRQEIDRLNTILRLTSTTLKNLRLAVAGAALLRCSRRKRSTWRGLPEHLSCMQALRCCHARMGPLLSRQVCLACGGSPCELHVRYRHGRAERQPGGCV